MPRINITSVYVDDQHKALDFYTRLLGFQTKTDIPVGPFTSFAVADVRAEYERLEAAGG